MTKLRKRPPKIFLFGHFGSNNFGNEATLQAMLSNLRRLIPSVELMCVTTVPERVSADYGIAAIPISSTIIAPWNVSHPLAKLTRKVFVGIPCEIYRWLKAFETLRNGDMLVVVGTGLLTDSFCLGSWGPYSVFKWSVAAKLSRRKLLFVSTGAGPLDRPIGRFLIKSALSLADFRSFRDQATLEYLKHIGFRRNADRVFPDLAFSLPPDALPAARPQGPCRPVVGLGLMEFDGLYGIEKTSRGQYVAYLETLGDFVKWVLSRDYDVRLLIGDLSDEPTVSEFRRLLAERSIPEARIIAEPITSTADLLSQIAATDFVVATRFHNVLLSLLLNKPSIAISFHHKCSSLMSQMGLSEYCQDIQKLKSEKLVEQFCRIEKNSVTLKQAIGARAAEFRRDLDEQYGLFLNISRPASDENPEHRREQGFAPSVSARENS